MQLHVINPVVRCKVGRGNVAKPIHKTESTVNIHEQQPSDVSIESAPNLEEEDEEEPVSDDEDEDILEESEQTKIIVQDSEPIEFWNLLGGQAPYPKQTQPIKESRLYQCSNATGVFQVYEVYDFCRDDLDNTDVFILDNFYDVWIWFGSHCSEIEKRHSMQAAMDYVKEAPDGRKDTKLYTTVSRDEPLLFIQHFHGWRVTEIPEKQRHVNESQLRMLESVMNEFNRNIYPYERLLQDPLPEGVDATHLETYLSDEEFLEILKMTKQEWEQVPPWKKDSLKQKVYLY